MSKALDPEAIAASFKLREKRLKQAHEELLHPPDGAMIALDEAPSIIFKRDGKWIGSFADKDSAIGLAVAAEIEASLPQLIPRALERLRQQGIRDRQAAREAAERLAKMLSQPIGGES